MECAIDSAGPAETSQAQRPALLRHSLAQGPWEHRASPTVPVPSATAPERRRPKQGSEHTHTHHTVRGRVCPF